MTQNARITIGNGCARSNTGYRKFVCGPRFETRPVLYRIYSGYQPERMTVQVAQVGDLCFEVEWGSYHENYTISLVTGPNQFETIPNEKSWPLWEEVFKHFPTIEGWLTRVGRGPSYLPADLWPEGRDLSVLAKANRRAAFETRFGVTLPDSVMTSPKAGLEWSSKRRSLGELLTFNPIVRMWDGSCVGINSSTTYYWSDGRGHAIEAAPLDCADYQSGSNYAHEETITETPKTRGLQDPPEWARFLVMVEKGAYVTDHHSHGCKLAVWQFK